MTESLSTDLIEQAYEFQARHSGDRAKAPTTPSCGAGATVAIQPDEFRAELACSCPEATSERDPYEQGFAAHESGRGLPDNPYNVDNCAHQQWANGWSQARDEAQRRARQFPR
jgi:ribosome modulation factor